MVSSVLFETRDCEMVQTCSKKKLWHGQYDKKSARS